MIMLQPITDLLEYSKNRKAAGESAEVAETHAKMLAQIIEANLATKQDIGILRKDIETLDVKLEAKINALDTKIDGVCSKLNWLVTLIGLTGIILAGLNLWHMFHS